MKKMKWILISLIFIILIGSCSKSDFRPGLPANKESQSDKSSFSGKFGYEAEGTASKQPQEVPQNETLLQSIQNQSVKLIQNANLRLEVKDYKNWSVSVRDIVKLNNGYISNSRIDVGKNDYKSGELIVRVPTDRYQQVLDQIKVTGKLLSEQITTEDVTEQYIDLKARLDVKLKAEKRMMEILATQIKKPIDLIEAEKQLQIITEQIEQLKGKLNYLNNKINFSTITIYFKEKESKKESFIGNVWKDFKSAIKIAIEGFFYVINSLIIILIAGIPVFILIFILWRVIKGYIKKRKNS